MSERRLPEKDCDDPLLQGLRTLGHSPSTWSPKRAPDHIEVPSSFVETARAAVRGALQSTASHEIVVDAGKHVARSLNNGDVHLGRFEILEELGVGSFGYVFLARDPSLQRNVAIKIQRAGPEVDPEERERFQREARSVAQLDHPGLVKLFEIGETADGVAFLVTEYIEGETLEHTLSTNPEQDHRDAARILAEIAEALHYAHEHGVIHRDVKPSNIMLDLEGHVHVMDFGLAKRDVGETTVTSAGRIMGTPAYMSPELARGDSHRVDARSDVFSLGVMLYELLAGERPFQGARRMLVLQVLEDDPRPPRRLRPSIPRDLETICLKAMGKSPSSRYASAGALAGDLRRYLQNEPILARPLGPIERLVRWSRKNPLAASLFVAILSTCAFGFWHLSRLSGELIESAAADSAARYADMLEAGNDLYSAEVVQRVGGHGIEVTADYAAKEAAVPLPATLLTELLERISEDDSGMRGRHYSEFPFRTRLDGGPRDDFQWSALRHLNENPELPYVRIETDADGHRVLRRATARRMKASCVECHNHHPDSTKRDWGVGDVRGILEIARPLELDEERVRRGLRGTFVLVGVVSTLFLGSIGLGLSFGAHRKRTRGRT